MIKVLTNIYIILHIIYLWIYTYIGDREVNVGGTACMCGGTHVRNTSEIGGITVTKIKKVSIKLC